MQGADFYRQLDELLAIDGCSEQWLALAGHPLVCNSFKARFNGVVLDFAPTIQRAATAVFPSNRVIDSVLAGGFHDGVLIAHHPMSWDLSRGDPFGFPDERRIEQLQERRIAFYSAHAPLDRVGPCFVSARLADALGVPWEQTFFPYEGADAGVIGESPVGEIEQLAEIVEATVGHSVDVKPYRSAPIRCLGIVGGGVDLDAVRDAIARKIDCIVTGLSVVNQYSRATHKLAQDHRIGWIGATHYSTERFGCEALAVLLRQHGVPARFIPDDPSYADYGLEMVAAPTDITIVQDAKR